MTHPRADAVIRRFMDGASISEVSRWLADEHAMVFIDAWDFIEQCIRRRLNAARKKGKR